LCTDTTGCGICQSGIHNIVKHNYYALHIDINTMLVGQASIISMHYKQLKEGIGLGVSFP